MSLVPLTSLVLRRVLRRSTPLAAISAKTWTLCAAEVSAVPPAIHLPDSLDRVTGVMSDTSMESELRRIRGGKVEHAATVVHTVARARLIRGSLYAGAWKHPLLERTQPVARQEEIRRGTSGALACSLYGNIYFGHWLRCDATLMLAAESLDEPVIVARAAYRHEPGYRRLLDLERRTCTAAVFERLLVLEDFGQNSFKRRRYRELRARLRARHREGRGGMVYLRRGVIGGRERRALLNAPEVERFLISQGARIIDPDHMSADEIVREVMGAKVVFSTEGSHMAHAIHAMADDAALCAFQPPGRFNNVYKDYTDCLGMRYAFVIGRPAEGGFTVDTEDIARTLDLVARQIGL
ncbi:MAG: glycosyltransferase family 61 protein [Candidatus Sulfotelmatobacter sp.]